MIVVGREILRTGDKALDKALARWLKVAEEARWKHFPDGKQSWPSADYVKGVVVFNILHNRFRLIAAVSYKMRTVRVCGVMAHADYDRSKF